MSSQIILNNRQFVTTEWELSHFHCKEKLIHRISLNLLNPKDICSKSTTYYTALLLQGDSSELLPKYYFIMTKT